jgi:hypothetical protein
MPVMDKIHEPQSSAPEKCKPLTSVNSEPDFPSLQQISIFIFTLAAVRALGRPPQTSLRLLASQRVEEAGASSEKHQD